MNNVKKSIGWADFTLNPVKGLCPMACPYCYARRMYKRFKWNPEIRFDNRAFKPLEKIKRPSRIFIGSTIELFGEWVGADAANYILRQVRNFPRHTFIFLTKQPENLAKWSPFPENCWVGVSATNTEMALEAWEGLADIEAAVRFISFEPLLERVLMRDLTVVDWLIIGQQTPVKASTEPKTFWIEEIEQAADKAGIPVFEKNNLEKLWPADWKGSLRQEFPKGVPLP